MLCYFAYWLAISSSSFKTVESFTKYTRHLSAKVLAIFQVTARMFVQTAKKIPPFISRIWLCWKKASSFLLSRSACAHETKKHCETESVIKSYLKIAANLLHGGKHVADKVKQAVPSPRGAFGGLASQNKSPSPPNWNMKPYKSVEVFSIFRVSSPPA